MKFAKHWVGLSVLALAGAAHADPLPFAGSGFEAIEWRQLSVLIAPSMLSASSKLQLMLAPAGVARHE